MEARAGGGSASRLGEGVTLPLRLKRSPGLQLEKGGVPQDCNPALPSIARLSFWLFDDNTGRGLFPSFFYTCLRAWETSLRKKTPNTDQGLMVRVIWKVPHKVLHPDHPPTSLPLPEEDVWPLWVQLGC